MCPHHVPDASTGTPSKLGLALLPETTVTRTSPRRDVAALGFDDAARLTFGEIRLLPEQQRCLRRLNQRIPALCNRMPSSVQTRTALWMQRRLAKSRLGVLANFYDLYYPPAWTVIYWLTPPPRELAPPLTTALDVQAAAMLLHLLDDHLVDGEFPLNNLALHLRTQAWMSFHEAASQLAASVDGGAAVAVEFLDAYFATIDEPPDSPNLAEYERLFRGQMATWLVAPLLTARLVGHDEHQVRGMFESFGLAWRLFDDLRDCAADARAGTRSGLYHLLLPEGQTAWRDCRDLGTPPWGAMLAELRRNGFRAALHAITDHLGQASKIARALCLPRLAEEYQASCFTTRKDHSLMCPLRPKPESPPPHLAARSSCFTAHRGHHGGCRVLRQLHRS